MKWSSVISAILLFLVASSYAGDGVAPFLKPTWEAARIGQDLRQSPASMMLSYWLADRHENDGKGRSDGGGRQAWSSAHASMVAGNLTAPVAMRRGGGRRRPPSQVPSNRDGARCSVRRREMFGSDGRPSSGREDRWEDDEDEHDRQQDQEERRED